MADRNLETDNPLLATTGLPDFAAIRPEHIVPAVKQIVSHATQRLAEIEQHLAPTWEGSLGQLEKLDPPFEYGWKPVGHLFGVLNSDELRTAYETILPEVVQFGLRASQSEPIYKCLKELRSSDEWSRLSEAQQRIITDRIKGAELSGIALEGEQRERFNAIEQELSQLSTDFSNHVLDATKAYSLDITNPVDTEGWPQTLRNLAAKAWNSAHTESEKPATPAEGPWRITLEPPLFSPFMEHCRNRELREQLYRAFVTRASAGELNNDPLITRILSLRKEKAKLLGYRNYAEISLARKMAPSVDAIRQMFKDLRTAAWDAAVQDLEDIKKLRETRGETSPLQVWDVAFWAERLREERYAYTDDELRPYFPFEKVLDGLFQLLGRLFEVSIHRQTDVSVWHPDVRFYRVHNASGDHVASFYLDAFSRPENKRGGAWMDDCLGRRKTGDHVQLPVAHLVCNQTPPHGDTPSLMSFREVETLFHEMGHGLQHMLTKVDYADCAGINGVEWDAVELPSQFMENWCYHRPTLMGLTGHYQTGEPLPDALFEKVRAAKNYRAGSMTLRQLLFGMTDIELHTEFDPEGSESVHELNRRLSQQTSVLPLLTEDRSLCSFQHIFSGGYAAGYYSYKWAEILSADAFSAFEEAGLDDPATILETGRRFRDTVLSLGGSRHPMDVFRAFRGREPQVAALLRHSGLGPKA
ncbi:M3 family metallopeptidase [Schlesneria sp. DSM 10557]|uniref:M3 family metallopeptidase n=1 Tax=Schlesneria sp. DSM 10557 TaxID=3044399 RepID=UPI0035A1210A